MQLQLKHIHNGCYMHAYIVQIVPPGTQLYCWVGRGTHGVINLPKVFICTTAENRTPVSQAEVLLSTTVLHASILDVSSLYTNIPHEAGINAIRTTLAQHRSMQDKPSNHALISLLESVVMTNNFQFNGTNYLHPSIHTGYNPPYI